MAVFRGTARRDVYRGTRENDNVTGLAGNDMLSGGLGDDVIRGGDGNDMIDGGAGNDRLFGDNGNDRLNGAAGNDIIYGGMGADMINGGADNDFLYGDAGNDSVMGGTGDDTAFHDITTGGADTINLGGELADQVRVSASATTNVRLTFTSAEVGNGNANDSNTMMNQDGGLAVRMQAEDGMGALTGPISRVDDEGVIFVGGTGVTFDVRDLVSGAARGEAFEVVALGTMGDDTMAAVQAARPYYFNGGMGNDTITDGTRDDFLVGGAGTDTLTASLGNDTFIGGGGNDTIVGGVGIDTIAAFNITTDGADSVNLGLEAGEIFNVSASAATNVRITFTSAEVGNGNALDSNTMMNQDGGLAVRMQAEDGMGMLPMMGNVTRVDDEGVTFVGGTGVTFDVRDLVSGAQRGELFEVVSLGTNGADVLTAVQAARPYYFNAGMGNDTVIGGTAADFLVGGAGNDTLSGGTGIDSYIGGGGVDVFDFNVNADSGIGLGNRDVIIDFNQGQSDVMDLGDFAGTFAFIGGGAFSGAMNEVRFETEGGNTIVQGDSNADGTADFEIQLTGVITLTAGDFVL